MTEKEMALRNCILMVRVGSQMYGTVTPTSDIDLVGVCIPDIDYVIGNKRFEQYQENTNSPSSGKRNTEKDKDVTIYSLPKFLHLLVGNNPNIIEILFAPENCITQCNKYGKMLLEHPEIFVSQKSYYTFSGYAYSQERKLTDKNPIGTRKELVDKFGYDLKFATHLIRLYYECIDILKNGRITLPHPERKKLLDIKLGKWKLEDILGESKRLKELTDKVWAESKLPRAADINAVNELQKKILIDYWKETEQI